MTAPGDEIDTGVDWFPLTGNQRELLLDQALDPDLPKYNLGFWLALPPGLSVAAVRAALGRLAAAHDALRLAINTDLSAPAQRVIAAIADPLIELDFSKATHPDQEARAWMQRDINRLFDLTQAPLWRAAFIRTQPGRAILYLAYHHLIADGISSHLALLWLGRELQSPSPLVAGSARPQFRPAVAADQTYRASARYQTDLAFWETRLADVPEPLFSRRPDKIGTTSSGLLEITLGEELYHACQREAACVGGQPFHLLLMLFFVFFSRTRSTDRLIFGVAHHNRMDSAARETLGYFSDVRPFLCAVDHDLSARDFLQRIIADWREIRHNRVPVGELNRRFGRIHSGRGHLFDVQFSWIPSAIGDEFGGAPAQPVYQVINSSEQAPLRVYCMDDGAHAELRLSLAFNEAWLDHASVERIGEGLELLLGGFLAQPQARLRDYKLVNADVAEQIASWGRGRAVKQPQVTVVDLFAAQVKNRPAATAVRSEHEVWTYSRLDTESNRIAHGLIERGIAADMLVGVCCTRTPLMIAGLLGILKAGGAYLPVDPADPPARIATLLEAGGARWLIAASADLVAPLQLALEGIEVLLLDGDWLTSAEPLSRRPRSTDLAYVNFTSGSSGIPKGVLVEHRGITRLVESPEFMKLDQECCQLQLAPITFDAATLEIWGPLSHGGCVALMPPGPFGIDDILRAINRQGVNSLFVTTGLFHQLVDLAVDRLVGLRQLLTGGDVVSGERVRKLLAAQPDCRLTIAYGPTENTTFTTCHVLASGESLGDDTPIGRPIAGTDVFVLDHCGQPVPVGQPGELCTGGLGLARGYLGRPDLTAASFVERELFGDIQRVYRTGDRVMWREDGVILFLGRMDRQIKLRGHRIEPEEIEAQLNTHPQVLDARVVVDGTGLKKRLTAHVLCSESDHTGLVERVLEHLSTRLPGYMIPAAVLAHVSWPLTATGKIDQRALASDERIREPASTGSSQSAVPSDELERLLAGLWCELLELERVGRRDNFFDLGGHSLLAMGLLVDIEARIGRHVSAGEFMREPTIAALAARLRVPVSGPAWHRSLELYQSPGADALLPPLWFAPGIDGNSHDARQLLDFLPAGQPLIGITAPAAAGNSADPVGQTAAFCVARIREVQATGPYRLAGYSFGGRVAQEIACQLEQLGESVDLLFLIEPDSAIDRWRSDAGGLPYCQHRVSRGAAVLVRSWSNPLDRLGLPGYGWEHLCAGGVVVFDVPTTHWGLMTSPYRDRVGAILAQQIDRLVSDREMAECIAPTALLPFDTLPDGFWHARVFLAQGQWTGAWSAIAALPDGCLPHWCAPLVKAVIVAGARTDEHETAQKHFVRVFRSSSVNPLDRVPLLLQGNQLAQAQGLLAAHGEARLQGVVPETVLLAGLIAAHGLGQAKRAEALAARLDAALSDTPDRYAGVVLAVLSIWPELARRAYGRVLAEGSGPARAALLGLALSSFIKRQDWPQAAAVGRQIIAACPRVTLYYPQVIHALARAGEGEEARALHREAKRRFSGWRGLHERLDLALKVPGHAVPVGSKPAEKLFGAPASTSAGISRPF